MSKNEKQQRSIKEYRARKKAEREKQRLSSFTDTNVDSISGMSFKKYIYISNL